MKMRKVGAWALSLAMAGTLLAGCASKPAESKEETEAQTAAAEESAAGESAEGGTAELDHEVLVGINQLVQHPALDAATKGFKEELTAKLGDKVKYDEQNAAGDKSTAATIANNLVNEKCDLILANATDSLLATHSATADIPILGTSITDYSSALNLTDFNGTVGGNISGTSDLAPLDQQAALFDELLPDAKTIGILYCSAEPNSKFQADQVQAYLEKAGKTVVVKTFTDSNDVQSVTSDIVSQVDAIYIPTDNTAASCANTINNVALPAKVPIICGEEGIMSGCGIATLSIDYYELGKVTGDMAAEILTGQADISEMPIAYYPDPVKEYDKDRCQELGITVPDDYTAYTAEEN